MCGESGTRAARLVARGNNGAHGNVTALHLRTKANKAPEMEMKPEVAKTIHVQVRFTVFCNDVNILIK